MPKLRGTQALDRQALNPGANSSDPLPPQRFIQVAALDPTPWPVRVFNRFQPSQLARAGGQRQPVLVDFWGFLVWPLAA